MNFLTWSAKKCVAVPEEFWREDKATVLAYINANPEKIYLLPDVEGVLEEEVSIRFASEVKFPCAAKLITLAGEFTVETLSDVLERISYDENFLPTGKNFLVVPEEFFGVAGAIRRQCSILQVPLEICAEEISTLAAEQKLLDNAAKLLGELDGVKTLRNNKAALKLPENISLVEEFFAAADSLEKYLQSSNTAIKLIVTGEPKARELLSTILERLNFEAEISADLSNCDACVFVANALDNDFAQVVADVPNKDKIVFVLIRPALREQDAAINIPQIFSDFAQTLDAKGFDSAPIFFLDAPEIVMPLLTGNDEAFTPYSLTDSLGLPGRESFFTQTSLEKIFRALPMPSNKALLKKTGVPQLENYLRQSLKKNPSMTEKLLRQVERAIAFIDDDVLKNIRLSQTKKLSAAARQTESLNEKIALIATQEKIIGSSATVKALLYDLNSAINNFLRAIAAVNCEIFGELTASDEFCAEKFPALHQGKISAELKTLVTAAEERLQNEYAEQFRQLIALAENLIDEHRTQAQAFINSVCSTTKLFSTAPRSDVKLPEAKSFDVPPFDVGLSEIFSSQNLSALVKDCTRIICTQEVEADWSFYKANSKRLLKHFYLAGTFRRELRQRLEDVSRNKIDALEKNLRQNLSAATLEYFTQVAKICRAQHELALNIFRQYTADICNRVEFLNQDFAAMEEVSRALKTFYDTWRLIYPEQSQRVPASENSSDNLLAEMCDRQNRLINPPSDNDNLSVEKFLPVAINSPNKTSNADFIVGKAAFTNKKYETAFKSFSRAAATGHVEAIEYLAYMNQKGRGMPKNIYAAIENYLDALNLGDNDVISELGEIFLDLECYSRALEYHQTAAERGDKHSIERLQ